MMTMWCKNVKLSGTHTHNYSYEYGGEENEFSCSNQEAGGTHEQICTMLCTCALLASVTSVLLGYDIGVMSGAIIFIQKDLKLTDVQIEILAGILSLYSLLGSFAAGRTSDYIGRRYTIVIAGLFFLAGSIFMGLAPNYLLLMIGRFIAGLGVGFGIMVASCYTAELSPPSCRGLLTSFSEVFINVGILLGYLSNLAFSNLPLQLGWRLMLGIGIIPSLFIIFGILLMPESPRWLVLQGRLKDARKVLERTSDSADEAVSRLSDIKAAVGIPEDCNDDVVSVPKHHRDGTGVYKELLFKPTRPVRHIVIALLGDQLLPAEHWHGRCGYLQPQNIRKGRNRQQ
ncbi:hypothetical protein QQ045_028747 [Rhodiola kirilowii]